jgi:hypothetical protein
MPGPNESLDLLADVLYDCCSLISFFSEAALHTSYTQYPVVAI